MTPKRWMLLTTAAACAALPAFGAANDTVTVTVTGELRQPVHFGIDAERLWFFWPERREGIFPLKSRHSPKSKCDILSIAKSWNIPRRNR